MATKKKPDSEKAIKVNKVIAPKPVTETVKYKSVIEIDASKLKILNIEGGKEGDKMLLKCEGSDDIHLGKGTDSKIITGENITHAVLVFDKVWKLVSICRL